MKSRFSLVAHEPICLVAGSGVDVELDTKLVRVHRAGIDDAAVVVAVGEAGYEAVRA